MAGAEYLLLLFVAVAAVASLKRRSFGLLNQHYWSPWQLFEEECTLPAFVGGYTTVFLFAHL
jgi:hypothetical protein